MKQQIQRFCGIELSGSKSSRTSLVFLDYYVNQKKLFLVDVFDHLSHEEGKSADQVLLDIISEFEQRAYFIGVGSPLALPPCLSCTRPQCPLPMKCDVPSVTWMRKNSSTPVFPYVQRPADLFWQNKVMHPVQVHNALDANKAPLSARGQFLRKHFKASGLFETDPRLSLHRLRFSIPFRKFDLQNFRDVERGQDARHHLIELFIRETGIFIYQRDISKIVTHLSNFDAFITAFTSFLAKNQHCEKPPKSFPKNEAWMWIPKDSIPYRSMVGQ